MEASTPESSDKPAEFAAAAQARTDIYAEADRDYETFWANWARQLEWQRPFTQVLEWSEPFVRWFYDGQLNASVNCLDRHVRHGRANRIAFYFEGEPGDRRAITYGELLDDVCRFANGLRSLGVRKGDRVAIYMPMIPELPVAMLACARIGAPHSIIYGGFSPDAIIDRMNDPGCVVLVTADFGWRHGKKIPLKGNCDAALPHAPTVRKCVVVKRTGDEVPMRADRDLWWDDVVRGHPATCSPEVVDAEDLLFILYTSGTSGKPVGIKHSTAGYLTQVTATHKLVFDIRDSDVYWCTADIGWVTGHSYLVYGPLANGTTTVLFEGTSDYLDVDRFWDIVERYRVTILYTTPTAIRTFMRWGADYPGKHDLSSLRLLGSVGEPINPEAWMWYHDVIGAGRCPVVDTWWQTETGAIMISPLPGVMTTLPGSATKPFPGIYPDVVDENGDSVPPGGSGYLVIRKPWPSMLRGIWGDDERYAAKYWSKFEHMYLAGDGCRRDEEGNYWFTGRIDDVLNVGGQRISATEVENTLIHHPAVVEAAVVGKSDEVRGEVICAFVVLKVGAVGSEVLADELRAHVASKLGMFTQPEYITFTTELPKTRSGKIMRRLLRDIAQGRMLGDTTTLADSSIVAKLQSRARVKAQNSMQPYGDGVNAAH